MKTTKKVAPDGGWGWVATFGVSLVNLATRSIEPSFGLLFGDFFTKLEIGTTGATLVISVLDVMMNFSGLFVGPLLKEFSYRKVAITGSLLCALGLALTSPVASMVHLFITFSVINGIGVGLSTSAAFVALNHYFKHKRGQAVGLSMAGTAVGMLIMPQLVRILLEEYSFNGAILLISGVALHAVVGAVLLQPAKWHLKEEEIDIELMPVPEMITIKEDDEDALPEMNTLLFNKHNMRKNFSELAMSTINTNSKNGLPKRPTFPRIMSNNGLATNVDSLSNNDLTNSIRRRKLSVMSNLSHLDFTGSTVHVHMNIGDEELEEHDQALRRVNTHVGGMTTLHRDSFIKMKPVEIQDQKPLKKCKQSFWLRFIELLDVGLLKDPNFLNILFGLSIFYVAEMNFKLITPFFFASLNFEKSDVAFCLSITAITDIAARVVLPPIFDRLNISKRTVFLISIIFVGITRSIMAEQTEWTPLMVWLSICGFFRGAALSNFTLTVSEYCSLEQLPSAFGWHLVGKAVFVTIFSPPIGAIRDYSGSFPLCIHSQTVCIFLCGTAWSVEYFITFIRNRKQKNIDLSMAT